MGRRRIAAIGGSLRDKQAAALAGAAPGSRLRIEAILQWP
jgi:hypothetical protein